ncbi:hypothetical protein cyc_01067 [Cyclospora cayetanensis]|uniref:Transmembrane protein n=1 Tax=Cyclospora cayetanensis TaxID=88456 RepID=A0A1D3D395_9EIME|nr:hypothetical protein cyc_01067 [Cyclospora cayetanensis]
MRPRMFSTSVEIDLETAADKFSSNEGCKDKNLVKNLKKASRLWIALAACVIFVFVFFSTPLYRSPKPPTTKTTTTVTPPESSSGRSEAQTAVSQRVGGHRQPVAALDMLHTSNSLAHQNMTPGSGARHPLHETQYDHEEWEFEEAEDDESEDAHGYLHDEYDAETHEHLADTHPEYGLDHSSVFDEVKQHPDEPEYIDIWDGVTHEDLHLSAGIPGLRTPLYRLPFVDGQHNNTHVIGAHSKNVLFPKYLAVSSGRRAQKISGTYKMYMIQDGRPKPHLNHGRLIWQKEGEASSMFLYYDHMHHTWVFNEQLDLQHPQPVAFLAHGAILPISKKNDGTFRKFGAPESVHWIVRDPATGGSRPDGSIKVEADPTRRSSQHLQALLLQKVYHAPEDGTNVYHTFDSLHPRYNHDEILKDPVAFVETNPHPDMVGPERLDGYSNETVPHPLRKQVHYEEEP